MGYLPGFVPQHPARRWTSILLLAALCAIPVAAQGVASAPATVSPQATAVTATAPAPVSAETAEFLASLSAAPTTAPPPSPVFLQSGTTGCVSNAQCPPDKLCCRDCGFFGCTHMACLTPVNGECPAIP